MQRTLKPTPNSRSALTRLMQLVPMLIILPLAACTILSTGTVRYLDTSCAAFKIITYSSKHDTPETIDQIRGHNAAYVSLCSKP